MKEPHREGVANHPDPESCAGGGNIAGEALTGVHAGQPLSSEITLSACRPCSEGEGHMVSDAQREPPPDAAESETLSMCGNSLHGNRETLETPSPDGGAGRSEKAYCRTPDMHVSRESDGPIVPEKRANKAGPSGGGVRGGKGIDQGKRHSNLTRTGLRAGETRHGIVGRTRGCEAG